MGKNSKKEALIEVQNVGLTYETNTKPITAIENISFQMEKGEFLCLLGPSGCGKSTLLKVIAGYLKPTVGSCLMKGKPILGPDWHRGVVFQSPTLYPWMSVRKNVQFGPKMKGLPKEKIEEITEYFLRQVGLINDSDQSTFQLSGGMKQRVALARALANEPEIILMDEPFGALDALTRVNMQVLIRKIWQKNNSTIFMITHDIDEALLLGTRVIVMSKSPGRILREFNINFTSIAAENEYGYVEMGEEYRKIKKEVLELM